MPWLLTSPGHQQPWYWLWIKVIEVKFIPKRVIMPISGPFCFDGQTALLYYSDGIMSAMASQITGVSMVCSNVWESTGDGWIPPMVWLCPLQLKFVLILWKRYSANPTLAWQIKCPDLGFWNVRSESGYGDPMPCKNLHWLVDIFIINIVVSPCIVFPPFTPCSPRSTYNQVIGP